MSRRVVNAVRDLWVMLGITLLFLVGMEVVARAGFALRDVWNNRGFDIVDPSLRADVYRDQEWAKEYWSEEVRTKQTTNAEWHSYVYWRRAPFQGKYINVDANGIRRTWNATSAPTSNQIKVAMFGGSALWGTGSRDDFTIPSEVSKQLKAKGVDAWVTNYGEGGYVSTQDVIALMVELQKGNVPDVVVFFDGANDVFSAIQQGVAGIPQNEYHRVWEFNRLNWRGALEQLSLYRFAVGLTRGLSRENATSGDSRLASRVLDIYSANLEIVRSLSRQYGFGVVFYWQPVVYAKKDLSAWERQQRDASTGAAFFRQVNGLFKERGLASVPAGVHDLSSIFDDEPGTVFVDPYHLSEAGNSRVAAFIIQTLPTLAPRAGQVAPR